jgi:hypothetical protein
MTNEKAELEAIVADQSNVLDETENDDTAAPLRYAITSYGADPDVESLVKRLRKKEIIIPPFQRNYVWSIKQASRLIESLLLGLPVPGIFLAKEDKSNKSLVVDGQQRLKSLQFFYDGFFNPKEDSSTKKVFKLADVQNPFVGKTYEALDEKDRIQLDTSIIHATIIKQESPPNDDTSVYHVFERLNSGGKKLVPQEIRTAVSHGPFIELLKQLNKNPTWRAIYGKESPRLKDQELVLRFLALYYNAPNYEKPIAEFLNKFTSRYRYPTETQKQNFEKLFEASITVVNTALGSRAFRPERSLNAAVYDSVMVGLARRLAKKRIQKPTALRAAYDKLLNSNEYSELVRRATSDEQNVNRRLELATAAFAKIQ